MQQQSHNNNNNNKQCTYLCMNMHIDERDCNRKFAYPRKSSMEKKHVFNVFIWSHGSGFFSGANPSIYTYVSFRPTNTHHNFWHTVKIWWIRRRIGENLIYVFSNIILVPSYHFDVHLCHSRAIFVVNVAFFLLKSQNDFFFSICVCPKCPFFLFVFLSWNQTINQMQIFEMHGTFFVHIDKQISGNDTSKNQVKNRDTEKKRETENNTNELGPTTRNLEIHLVSLWFCTLSFSFT